MWSVLGVYVTPYIAMLFSWVNSLPIVGQIIFITIVTYAATLASMICYAYYVKKCGIDFSVKWKWYGARVDITYK